MDIGVRDLRAQLDTFELPSSYTQADARQSGQEGLARRVDVEQRGMAMPGLPWFCTQDCQ